VYVVGPASGCSASDLDRMEQEHSPPQQQFGRMEFHATKPLRWRHSLQPVSHYTKLARDRVLGYTCQQHGRICSHHWLVSWCHPLIYSKFIPQALDMAKPRKTPFVQSMSCLFDVCFHRPLVMWLNLGVKMQCGIKHPSVLPVKLTDGNECKYNARL